MRPFLRDTPILQDYDAAGVVERRQAVGDYQSGPAYHQVGQRVLNQRFSLRVHAGGGLIQNQNGSVFQESSGQSDALPLATGEGHSSLSHCSVIPLGQGSDKVMYVCGARRLFNLFVPGFGLAVEDIFPNGR